MKKILLTLLLALFSLQATEGKKVLFLIIASDNFPIYTELQKSWRAYMESDPEHIQAYFLKGDPKLSTPIEIIGDTIWCQTTEGYPEQTQGIITKTISSMELLLERIKNEFDYVVRTNLSSFYIFPRFLNFIETLPPIGCYCGDNTGGDSIIGSGAGFILSPDLVELLVQNKNRLIHKWREPDDCIIGFFLKDHGFHLRRHYKINIESLDQWNQMKDNFPADIFQIRVKTNTSNNALRIPDELIIHSELYSKFYE